MAIVPGMRIALVNPTYWPEVRRGSERLIHDLGVSLVARGHEVTLLTTHAARGQRTIEDGIEVVRARRPIQLPERLRLERYLADVPQALLRIRGGRFDVAHSFSLADGWAALLSRRLGGPQVVHSLHGIPTPTSLGSRRGRVRILKSLANGGAIVSALSDAAAAPLREQLRIDVRVLPGGVRSGEFGVRSERTEVPTLFCPASIGDPRKRVQLLIDAFQQVRETRPDTRLVLTESRDPVLSREAISLREGVEVVDADATQKLAKLYANAWVTVLPSVDEAFGLVLLESLAAGTPVVAARSGACPEIVHDESIGRLFEPDVPADLRRALAEALALAEDPGTAEACRKEAAQHDWSQVVNEYEDAYRAATATYHRPAS